MTASGISHVIIETSGSSEPEAVIDAITQSGTGTLHAVATVVDARMLLHDFDEGKSLHHFLNQSFDTITAESLLISQLRVASLIILTKLDLVPEDKLPSLLRAIQSVNPNATLVGCAHGNIDTAIILDAPTYQRKPRTATAIPRGSEIGSTVIRDPRPLHPQRFFELYREKLGLGLFRSKGFIWFASRPSQVLLWNQAGGAMGLEFLATWKSHILRHDPRLLPDEKDFLSQRLAALHPQFGDRSCDLTLIGHARDLEIFGSALLNCFCTDEEIRHWQDGGTFPDPWPANLKIMP